MIMTARRPFRKPYIACALLLGAASLSLAQGRPGIDRPIRVGMFKGIGTGSLWHPNIHTSHTVMEDMLAYPLGANLGPNLDLPPAGFTFYSMPVALAEGSAECAGNGCGPTPEQLVSIVASLDTLDVLVMNSTTAIGSRISDSAQRLVFENFWETKGYVSIHVTTDTKGFWPKQDSIHGTRFNNHPVEQVATIRRDSVHQDDSAWQYLNRGLFSNGTDTSFLEEFLFFTNTGAEIRARPHLKPTVKLIQTGMTGIQSLAMDDHPLSWYRSLPTGGRTFYTALGHRPDVWQNTRTFRRQVYNAVLWAAKYDSVSRTMSIADADRDTPERVAAYSRLAVTPGALTVTTIHAGSHAVELLRLDGRRLDIRKGTGPGKIYNFTGLRPGVRAVAVWTPVGRAMNLVMIP